MVLVFMITDMVIPSWVYPLVFWMIAWKAVAAWKAARKGHLVWFVSFFIFNTLGILPIIYILFFQNLSFSVKGDKSVKKKVAKKKAKKFPTLV